jgi:hypothetical protein
MSFHTPFEKKYINFHQTIQIINQCYVRPTMGVPKHRVRGPTFYHLYVHHPNRGLATATGTALSELKPTTIHTDSYMWVDFVF